MVCAFSLTGFEPNHDEDDRDDPQYISTEDVDYGTEHLHSFAHAVNLVVQDGFKNCKELVKVLEKISAIETHLIKSKLPESVAAEEKYVVPNRWINELMAMRSLLEIENEAVSQFKTPYVLTDSDRHTLTDVVQILTPLETVVNLIQGDLKVTSSMVIPCIKVLKTQLQQLSNNNQQSNLAENLYTAVENRLTPYESSPTFISATILDPRFRLQWCTSEEKPKCKATLEDKLKTEFSMDTTTDDSIPSYNNFFAQLLTPNMSKSPPPSELEMYLLEQTMHIDSNPLSYWQLNAIKFPMLYEAAVKYLAIPASSAPVEKVFNIAGKQFRPDRCDLNDKTFEKLMFIRGNTPC